FYEQTYQSKLYNFPFLLEDRTAEPEVISGINTHVDPNPVVPTTSLQKLNVVRARAFKTGALPSSITTKSYLLNENGNPHELPIVSLVLPAKSLFDYDDGIYIPGVDYDNWRENSHETANNYPPANFQRSREYQASLEFIEPDGQFIYSQDIGVRIHGGASRRAALKSLRLYARNEYDDSRFNFPFFPDQPDISFNRLMLRNSGNDFVHTMFRDAAIQRIISSLNVDTQSYRPVAHYINGEYWGLINIRERYDKHYIERVYGVDGDNIDLLTFNGDLKEGSTSDYRDMLQFIRTNEITDPVIYDSLRNRMDMVNFIDYKIANIFASNLDWPGNNIDFWRYRVDQFDPQAPHGKDGRWRWMVYDMDFGFGLAGGLDAHNHNTLEFATEEGGQYWPNPDWSTYLLRTLLQNDDFRTQFIVRFSDLLNTVFLPDRTTQIIEEMKENIRSEMELHLQRWTSVGIPEWEEETSIMTVFANKRPESQRNHIQEFFDLEDSINISIETNISVNADIRINTVALNKDTPGIQENVFPWTGTYFAGIPIQLEASIPTGYQFTGWSADSDIILQDSSLDSPSITIIPSADSDVWITANYELLPDSLESQTIQYWSFNNLPDGIISRVFADWSLTTNVASITYEGPGTGFLDKVTAGTVLNHYDDTEAGDALRVRNPSDTKDLIIQAPSTGFYNLNFSYAVNRTNNGARLHDVYYRTGSDESWILLEQNVVNDAVADSFKLVSIPLVDNNANNNSDLAFRIQFKGDYAGELSGNNRFDNVQLTGIQYSDIVLPEIIHLWHFNNLSGGEEEFVPSDVSHDEFGLLWYDGEGQGFLDDVNPGTTLNSWNGFEAGKALRVRNPSNDRALIISATSQQFERLEFSYAFNRTNNGARIQKVFYRTEELGSWQQLGEPIEVEMVADGFQRVTFYLADTLTYDNSNLQFRIEFDGEEASGVSGNNRIDNIMLRGHQFTESSSEPPVETPNLPVSVALEQNYPNPFNSVTSIPFEIPESGHVKLDVFSVTGQHISTLVSETRNAGSHIVRFDAGMLSSGVYIYRLQSNGIVQTRKLMLIK
ncbi:MAG: CotH kinase family protein, partial [Balneolales bacterium]|nr:CotH kinase family protein [Balneolales bacterium]